MAPPSLESPIGPKLRRSTQISIPPLYEPHSYCETHTNPFWQQAINEELNALHKNHTWDMVDLPPSQSVIGCRWVYKIKTKADGSVEWYKARLVAKGFTQEYGIDYEEKFAPVARLTSVKCLITVAVVRRLPLYQMYVKIFFLNGDLQEEVYMQPPPGYPHSGSQVCRLRRALYGLKQAPQAQFEKFSSIVTQQIPTNFLTQD